MADSEAFKQWVADVRAVSREYYDATPEQMFGRKTKKLGQSILQFYRDWYSPRLSPSQGLGEIITDIERKLETGVGTLDRGEA
jgi:hypothetical protein